VTDKGDEKGIDLRNLDLSTAKYKIRISSGGKNSVGFTVFDSELKISVFCEN
jgi:hypothetical protein